MYRVSRCQNVSGFISGMEEDYDNFEVKSDTPASSLIHAGGRCAKTVLTHTGNGGTTENVFTFEGSVRIIALYGLCAAVVDSTTFSGVKFEVDDGTVQADLSTTVNCSGIVAGGLVLKENDITSPLVFSNPTAVTVLSASNRLIYHPVVIQQKTGDVTSYIRVSYTGDAATDITMGYHVVWTPFDISSAVETV